MHDFATLPRLLAALGLTLPLLAALAQTPALTAAERAQRDAEKVFSFIKFQTVPAKPATEPRSKPARPPAASPERAGSTARPDAATAAATERTPTPLPEAPVRTEPALAQELPLPAPLGTLPTPSTPVAGSPAAVPVAAPEADTEAEERDEVALQMVSFVSPVLTQAVQATLGAGARQVKVRFTVEPSGQVSHAEAAAGVPRRLAKPAIEAILQWRFAPLPQARTVDVEIAFKRD